MNVTAVKHTNQFWHSIRQHWEVSYVDEVTENNIQVDVGSFAVDMLHDSTNSLRQCMEHALNVVEVILYMLQCRRVDTHGKPYVYRNEAEYTVYYG